MRVADNCGMRGEVSCELFNQLLAASCSVILVRHVSAECACRRPLHRRHKYPGRRRNAPLAAMTIGGIRGNGAVSTSERA